jgi:hypothetical protein
MPDGAWTHAIAAVRALPVDLERVGQQLVMARWMNLSRAPKEVAAHPIDAWHAASRWASRWQRRRRQAVLVDALLVDVVLGPDAHLGRPVTPLRGTAAGRRGLPARLGDEQTSAKLCCFESD